MKALKLPITNKVLGAPKDWDEAKHGPCDGLPVHISEQNGMPVIFSYWQPSPEEIALIINGMPIRLAVFGHAHPPVGMDVEP